MAQYDLWKVTYSYGMYAGQEYPYSLKQSCIVIASSKTNALTKAHEYFFNLDMFRELISDGEVRTEGATYAGLRKTANKIKQKIPIQLPKLTLDSDVEQFDIQARIGSDGQTLEFIVVEK